MVRTNRFPIAIEGFPFVIPMVLAIAVVWFLGLIHILVGLLILTLFAICFFRNPKREIPACDGVVLSPADGRVLRVDKCQEGRFLGRKVTKISIFMSIFDVHVNRSPISGILEKKSYNPGRFNFANRDKSSMENEQNAMVIQGEDGLRILTIQIAGFIARRIVCYPEEGEPLKKGQIFGMIRFGSRLDVYVPEEVEATVKPGVRVKAGQSVLGTIR